MNLKHSIAFLSLLAMGTTHADEPQPLYYEDYLKTLQEQQYSANTDEETTPDVEEDDEVELSDLEEAVEPPAEELIAEATAPAELTKTATNGIDMIKLSEAFGNFLGKNLHNSGIEFDENSLIMGIRKGLKELPSPLSESEYESMMMAVQQKAFEKVSSDNLAKAEAFLKDNSKKEGVLELVPGKLQYQVLQAGNGATVALENTPLINYTGKFLDGTTFSSSEETGGAITIPLSHTIPGFQKGIVGMREGEKRRLFIHPEEGYGATGGHLPPNSLLIFDIEVVEADHVADNDIDDSDVEPADEDIDNSDVDADTPDKMMEK